MGMLLHLDSLCCSVTLCAWRFFSPSSRGSRAVHFSRAAAPLLRTRDVFLWSVFVSSSLSLLWASATSGEAPTGAEHLHSSLASLSFAPDPLALLVASLVGLSLLVSRGLVRLRGSLTRRAAYQATAEVERRAVVVTGASSGLGLQIALRLLARGFFVVGTCLDASEAQAVSAEIRRRDGAPSAEYQASNASEAAGSEHEKPVRKTQRDPARSAPLAPGVANADSTPSQSSPPLAPDSPGVLPPSPAPARGRPSPSLASRFCLLQLDVAVAADVARAAEDTKRFLKRNDLHGLYAVVNCAGVWDWSFLSGSMQHAEVTAAVSLWERLINVNFLGSVRVLHTFLPMLHAFSAAASSSPAASPSVARVASLPQSAPCAAGARWSSSVVSASSGCLSILRRVAARLTLAPPPRVVLVGSILGRLSAPGQAAYSASKAGVRALACAARRDLRGTGVRVVLVEPGAMRTRLFEKALAQPPTNPPVPHPLDPLGARGPCPAGYAAGLSPDSCLRPPAEAVFVAQCRGLLAFASSPEKIADRIIAAAICSASPPDSVCLGWDTYVWRLLERLPSAWRDFLLDLLFLSPHIRRLTEDAASAIERCSSREARA
ncbi:hypothetical protein BESB_012960 [Besnoitia besnoiti]|uniref:Oxidoreductase, short chain dehydrogenase/reductase family protein n=1 Tax=Besnoitia besnoiti TaxID=94643 RepID=A0A2A9M665_BESBE|nr:hypothetical protein BESB_012960 [Besnoitia besnoiti]PFH32684.1 hypothetical protein BESB_012960 [Besnoitia besnoiti]